MITLQIDPQKRHTISPYLYMQFMEPLGVCDPSVDAAWDYVHECWHPPLIDAVRDLAPSMVRFGGCFASYYRWREAVGAYSERKPMINYCWGGIYANHVGTHEFVDFCRQTNAEPLLVVNMESDGRMHWAYPENGDDRFGTAEEAAEWVSYCNDPDNPLRLAHGHTEPYNVRWWQIGNETAYDRRGYGIEKTVEVTNRFAAAMRDADPTIKLIGWGDNHSCDGTWTRAMRDVEGVDLIAFHHHFGSGLPDSPLRATDYRLDFENTWTHLMHAYKSMENHIAQMRSDCGTKRLAMTEGHFGLPGRNRNEVLSTWGAGIAYARCHNVLMRNSDILDIATLADFFGTSWQVNAILMPNATPYGIPYLQPVGAVMRLFRRHQGERALEVSYTGAVDAVASATDNRIYLHIANTDMHAHQTLKLDVSGRTVTSARMYCIAADAETEITPDRADCFAVRETVIDGDTVILPPAAAAAIEIDLSDPA